MIIQLENGKKIEMQDGSTPAQIDDAIGHVTSQKPDITSQSQDFQSMKDNARIAMSGQGDKLLGISNTEGLPAKLAAYGANAGQGLPFIGSYTDEIASGIGALPELANGTEAYSNEYNRRQMAQQAMREVGSELNGGATALGQGGAAVAGMAVPVGQAASTGGALAKALKVVGMGAVGGALYGSGEADSTLPTDQAISQRLNNAETMGAVGAALPVVGSGVGRVGSYLGKQAAPVVRELAAKAEAMGIPLTADQISNTPMAQNLAKVLRNLPFSGRSQIEEAQRAAYAGNIGREAGIVGELSPTSIKAAHDAAGSTIGEINTANSLKIDSDTLNKLSDFSAKIEKDYKAVPDGQIIKNQIDNLLDSAKNGEVDGVAYQKLRTKLLQLQDHNLVGRDAGELRGIIDQAFANGLAPDDAAALAVARGQYRVGEMLKKPLAVSGANAGDISPNAVFNRLSAESPNEAAYGGSNLSDIARVGKQFLQFPQGSDTQSKMMIEKLLGAGGVGAAGGLGYMAGIDPATLAMYLGATLPAGRAVSSLMRTKAAQNFALHGAPKTAASAQAIAKFLRSGSPISGFSSMDGGANE